MTSSRITREYPTVRIRSGRGWVDASRNKVAMPPEGDKISASGGAAEEFFFRLVDTPVPVAVLEENAGKEGEEPSSGDVQESRAADRLLDEVGHVAWFGLQAEGVALGEAVCREECSSDEESSILCAACAMAAVKAESGWDVTNPLVFHVSGDKNQTVTLTLRNAGDAWSVIAQTPRVGSEDKVLKVFQRDLRSRKGLSLILADVDHSTALKELYGYRYSDLILTRIYRIFEIEESGSQGEFYRIGGDDFAMLIPGADPGTAEGVADRVRVAVRDMNIPLDYDDEQVRDRITLSVGVVHVRPEARPSPKELWQIAGHTLWKAQQEGRDNVKIAVAI